MKATDLRIGNLVFKNGIFHTVTANDLLEMIYCDIAKCSYLLEPIELTIDMLLRFGFTRNVKPCDKNFQKQVTDDLYFIAYMTKHEMKIELCSKYRVVGDFYPKVHELQNLYSALKSSELVFLTEP